METAEFAVHLGAVWAKGLFWRKAPLPKYTLVTASSASSLEESLMFHILPSRGFYCDSTTDL